MTPLEGSTKSDKVYEFLKEKILATAYKPGERIVIRTISRQLGVSDIPVREAMKKLASEGMLEFKSHSGAKVASMNVDHLEEIFLIRTELESFAAGLAATHATDQEIAELEKYVRQMNECYESGNIFKYSINNSRFHQTLYGASHVPLLVDMIDNLSSRSERSKAIFSLDPQRLRDSNAEHQEVIEALKVRDKVKAARIIRAQKEKGFSGVLTTLRAMKSLIGE